MCCLCSTWFSARRSTPILICAPLAVCEGYPIVLMAGARAQSAASKRGAENKESRATASERAQCRPLQLWLDAREVGQDGASGDWEDFQESADAIVLCEDNSSLESPVKRQARNARLWQPCRYLLAAADAMCTNHAQRNVGSSVRTVTNP